MAHPIPLDAFKIPMLDDLQVVYYRVGDTVRISAVPGKAGSPPREMTQAEIARLCAQPEMDELRLQTCPFVTYPVE